MSEDAEREATVGRCRYARIVCYPPVQRDCPFLRDGQCQGPIGPEPREMTLEELATGIWPKGGDDA